MERYFLEMLWSGGLRRSIRDVRDLLGCSAGTEIGAYIDLLAIAPVVGIASDRDSKFIYVQHDFWKAAGLVVKQVANYPEVVTDDRTGVGYDLGRVRLLEPIVDEPVEAVGASTGEILDEDEQLGCEINHIR